MDYRKDNQPERLEVYISMFIAYSAFTVVLYSFHVAIFFERYYYISFTSFWRDRLVRRSSSSRETQLEARISIKIMRVPKIININCSIIK